MLKKYIPYIISVIISLGVGALSAFLTAGNMQIYNDIVNPPLAPPSVVFPIVWTVLYTLMGIGSAIIFVNRKKNPEAAYNALILYAVNLVLNFFWSLIFFNLRAFLFSFIWLLLLWYTVLLMIKAFKAVSPFAAKLQIPYLIWLTFALYLNFAIYLLNR